MKRNIIHPLVAIPFITAAIAMASAGGAGASGSEATPPPANSAATPDPAANSKRSDVDPDAAAAMAKQHGISNAEAKRRLGQQKSQGERGARIEASLGGRTGGIYIDSNGDLVVTTVDTDGDAEATRNGARPQRVDDSAAELADIMSQLDEQSRTGGAGSVQGWHVDVPTNTVILTTTAGATDPQSVAMKSLAARFGDSVRVEERSANETPKPAEWMVGGYQYLMPNGYACSVGFNTVDSSNRNVVLTAGHCVTSTGNMTRNGYIIGAGRTSNYPGDDYGTFWNSYPSYWQPSVSVSKYNGSFVNVRGQWDAPPVGATVCKSGRTTGYTCGTITALNQTVVYTGGKTLYGLVRHNACVEGGDSGGSNISGGAYALGITSGASTPTSGTYKDKCLSKSGQANISWYQPVGEALRANNLRLLYQA